MATTLEIRRDQELLQRLGLPPVKVWPPRCTWYNPDGSVNGNLPCDSYSRLLYLSRGLRPDTGTGINKETHSNNVENYVCTTTLLDAVVELVEEHGVVEVTASELLNQLKGRTNELPGDATRLSRLLTGLASPLASNGIILERTKTKQRRGIRLWRR